MSQTTKTFLRIPLTSETAHSIMRVMLQAVGFHVGGMAIQNGDDYRYSSHKQLDLAVGPTCNNMPCFIVSTSDVDNDFKPLVIVSFDETGISMQRFDYGFFKVVSLSTLSEDITRCCKALFERMLNMAKTYIMQHFQRFAAIG